MYNVFYKKMKNKIENHDTLIKIARYLRVLLLSDSYVIKKQYEKFNKKVYKADNLISFSDKVYKIMLGNEIESYNDYVDKYKVREFISKKIGSEYLTDLYSVYFDSDELSLESLPESFVLKLNNGSGMNEIVYNKNEIDEKELKLKIKKWLKSNPYSITREKQYKNVKHCILAEELLISPHGLKDYKFFCFSGEPEFIQVISERSDCDISNNFYDLDWNLLPISRAGQKEGSLESKPENLDKLTHLVRKLASDFNFVRIDFYIIGDRLVFGEFTFTPANGRIEFLPIEIDRELAKKIKDI